VSDHDGREQIQTLKRTPLHALHRELGARMVSFAGYEMPVQYPDGIIAEHTHTRTAAGLFDVSHMGQAWLAADRDVAGALESLVPGDIVGLEPGQMRYTVLLNDTGGIIDDLIVARPADAERLTLVVNAARKDVDYSHIGARLAGRAALEPADRLALLALQGPAAAAVFERLCPAVANLHFMMFAQLAVDGISCAVARSGYTGEDGFEISVPATRAVDLARKLLDQPEVRPIGLGARDTLRLEAGLCLYGHDIDETTSPVEASLAWTVARRRREAADFPGADRILREIRDGPARRRVGLRPEGRSPAREGSPVLDRLGLPVGVVTSGGFGPTVGAPVTMGMVQAEHAVAGANLKLAIRDKQIPAEVVPLPFVAHKTRRAGI
jgi:aminomethyltransferase